MKARIKSTNEVVDLKHIDYSYQGICSYITKDGELSYIDNQNLIFINDIENINNIDWEQRRYEIAKEILCNSIVINKTTDNINKSLIHSVIEYADELINQLKEE